MDQDNSLSLLPLLDAVADGCADDEIIGLLENRLVEEPDSVRGFVHYLDMHSALRWMAASATAAGGAILWEEDPTPQLSSQPVPPGRAASRVDRRWLIGLAASLLLCALSFWLGSRVGPTLMAHYFPSQSAEEQGVARITGLVDCRWGADQSELVFGQAIPSGQRIELTEGLLQFTFESGAKVVMQGPATFTPGTAMSAELASGKLSAVVPEAARGYTVTTPTAEIVDLGTEFGLEVDGEGATEVHVLDGDVLARGRRSDGKLRGEAIHAQKEDALRFVSQVDDVGRLRAAPEKFARKITPKLAADELPPLPVVHDLELWLAADLLVSRGSFGRVSAWRDICIGDNQLPNDACQFVSEHQPQWVEDTGNGQPAIRFDGASTRLFTDAINTGDRITLFVVCAPSEFGQNPTRWGGQLFNFGGRTPTIELAVHHNQIVYSGLWAADAVGVELITGEVRSKRIIAGPRYLLAYSYDMDSDQAELWVNGVSQGTAPAPLSPQSYRPRTIGGHGYHDYHEAYYRGDVFEVLLFDESLNESEHAEMTDYLCDRYEIER